MFEIIQKVSLILAWVSCGMNFYMIWRNHRTHEKLRMLYRECEKFLNRLKEENHDN